MNAIRDIVEVKSDHINYALPHGFSSGKVELIIIPFEKEEVFRSDKKQDKSTIRGSLRKYANPALAQAEENAWSRTVRDKHANS